MRMLAEFFSEFAEKLDEIDALYTVEELTYILALTMREAAGSDGCWTHDVIGDWKEISPETSNVIVKSKGKHLSRYRY